MSGTVFISYRRDGGEAMAQLIHDRLISRGFSVFYDIESLKSGPFDAKLFEQIESCDNFVLILPPQGLDRCVYEEDWVRQEIRHALECGKNIVPVMMRGFEFPFDLPEDIRAISRCNGVRFDDMNFLDAKVDKIISLFTQKGDTEDTDQLGHQGRHRGPSMIANVCSIGAVDREELWPTGKYSSTISIDEFNVIRFHVSLIKPLGVKKQVHVGFYIYDENDSLVSENDSYIDFLPSYDRYSTGWIIKGTDGSFVKAGVYRAEFWIENSRVYEYLFRLTSNEQESLHSVKKPRYQASNVHKVQESGLISQRKAELEDKLSRPKGFLFHVLMTFGWYILIIGLTEDALLLDAIGLLLLIAFGIKLAGYTKQHVWKNTIGAVILTIFGSVLYGAYLLATAIICLFRKSAWEQELERLKL